MTSKDYAFVEGTLYDKDDEIEVTSVELNKLWFNHLKVPILIEKGEYYLESLGSRMRSRFVMINVGHYLYENSNGVVKVYKVGSNNDFIVKEVEPLKCNTVVVKSDYVEPPQRTMWGRQGFDWPPEYDKINVGKSLSEMDTVPAILGPGDWKSKVNEELQRRGLNAAGQIKYEHEVSYTAGVPQFKSYVWFRGVKIMGDSYTPSKKKTEQEVAAKVYKVLKKDPI